MFDLEKAIADWRKQMLAAGINAPVPLDELESHLREEIDRQRCPGMGEEQVFDCAAKTVGPAAALKNEFQKVERSWPLTLVNLAGIAFLVIAGFFSLMIAPKLFHHAAGIVPRFLALALVAVTVLSWRYGYKILPSIPDARRRALAGLAGCAAATAWMLIFFIYVVPEIIVRMVGQDALLGWYFLSFLGAFAVVAILAGVGHGLEKVANRDKCRIRA